MKLFLTFPHQIMIIIYRFITVSEMEYLPGRKRIDMLKIAICDNSSVQSEIVRAEIARSIDSQFLYELTFWHDNKSFEHKITSQNCPYDIVILNADFGNSAKSGIALAKKINYLNPMTQIIFVSPFLEYAPDVYVSRHTYFISSDRISELMTSALNTAFENLSSYSDGDCLYIKVRKSRYKIPQNKILYMERNIRETTIYTHTDEFHTSEKIDSILTRLPAYFIACHRSYAINLKMAVSIHRNCAVFSNGKTVPIGRTHYNDVKETLSLINAACTHI